MYLDRNLLAYQCTSTVLTRMMYDQCELRPHRPCMTPHYFKFCHIVDCEKIETRSFVMNGDKRFKFIHTLLEFTCDKNHQQTSDTEYNKNSFKLLPFFPTIGIFFLFVKILTIKKTFSFYLLKFSLYFTYYFLVHFLCTL